MTDEELKPLTFGEVMDKTYRLGFASIRAFLPLYIFNFLFLSAIAILNGFLFSQLTKIEFIDLITGYAISSGSLTGNPLQLFNYYGFTLLISLPSVFSYALIVSLTIKSYLKQECDPWQEVLRITKKFPLLLIASLFATIIGAFGVIGCGIGIIATMAFMAFYVHALVYENVGVFGSIGRSAKLVSYSFWQLLGAFILGGLIINSISFLTELIVNPLILKISNVSGGYKELIVGLLNGGENIRYLTVLLAAGTAIVMTKLAVSIIVTAMTSAFNIILFFNQKVRFENFGLERMADVFAEISVEEGNEPPQINS